MHVTLERHPDAHPDLPRCRRRRRRRRRRARRTAQGRGGDGGRRRGRAAAACRRGVDGDAAASARGAYAARGQSKSRRCLDIARRCTRGRRQRRGEDAEAGWKKGKGVRRAQISRPGERERSGGKRDAHVYYPRDESLWPPAPPATTDRAG